MGYNFDGQFGKFSSGCNHQMELAQTAGNMAVLARAFNSWNAELVQHVKEVTTEAPTTEAPTTTAEPTTEEVTTAASGECSMEFPSTLINADHTIRLLDSSRRDHCAFKKYSS